MSFVGRWWRALNTQYDILDTWPITFFTLTLTLALSIPSLLYYTYGPDKENAAEDSYYRFDYASHWYYLSQSALQSLQLWRLPASQLVWPTSAELIFGTPLLLLLRVTEWQLADAHWKRALILLSAFLLSMGGDALLAAVAGLPVQSGPYWLVFFLLPVYAVQTPVEWSFKLWKLSLSNKVIVYFLALHLLVVLVPASCLAAVLPLALALLYLLIRFCVSGGMDAVLHPSRPQGMRVGRRGESSGHRLGGGPAAAGGGRSTAAADAARGAPRPASQYEKLIASAQAGKAKAPGGGAGGAGGEAEVEVETQNADGGGRHANEVGSHYIRYTQPTQSQDESLVSNTATNRPANTAMHHTTR